MHDDQDDFSATIKPEAVKAARPRRTLMVALILAVVAVIAAVDGISDRAKSRQELVSWTNEQAVPTVGLTSAKRGPSEEDLVLPGTIAAFNRGTIYARASGYVTGWFVDIGARVKKGDVLATIDAPDLDQQLAQARADLASAKANHELAIVTLQRWQRLATQNIVSQQDKDEKSGDQLAKQAAVEAAKANVARLEALSAFKNLTAPFDGIVTSRSLDIGDLVNAGGTSGRALFQVSDLHKVRIYVNVPQAFLADMKEGVTATLKMPGKDQTFEAVLTTTSNSLTENNRSALIQLQADNPDDVLWPGAYAEVHFHIPSNADVLRIPATALIFGPDGLRVATVGPDHKVVSKPVQLGRNLGKEVEIVSGLSLDDRIIDSPQESLAAGETVRIAGSKDDSHVSAVPAKTKEADRAQGL
jgi:RND family efflux transporter MFP subunit